MVNNGWEEKITQRNTNNSDKLAASTFVGGPIKKLALKFDVDWMNFQVR